LEVGERYGFIRFGSRVDLYLPINSKIKVSLGEKVFNGETIIAELKK
jgi:phosphatidylserine decarboxylase